MSKNRKVFRLYGAWNADKEAKWLSDMGKSGWRLSTFCLGLYTFETVKPDDCTYEIDFSILSRQERGSYFALYREAGWEYVTSFANWHYFRAPTETATRRPAYSDVSSKRGKLRRVLAVVLASTVPMTYFGIINPVLNGYIGEDRIYYVIGGFSVFVIAACLYAVLRIAIKLKHLE